HHESNIYSSTLVESIVDAPPVLAADHAPPQPGTPPTECVPLLGATLPRNRIMVECGFFMWEWASLLTPTFHYIETHRSGRDENAWHEYYDLTDDPHELSNLLLGRDIENDPQIAGLSALLAADRACRGPSCPGPADPPVEALQLTPPREDDSSP